jgi:glycerol-3-phosphate dehydrogenase
VTLKRDVARLAGAPYDVLIIGGGIYGVCIAWDAALRGLSVALVDKGDLGHATSANTLRVIHGGLRYLQRGDVRRVRQSIRERGTFMRIAPHLVHPLPFLIPTYGRLARGRAVFSVALLINDLLAFDRRRPGDAARELPGSRLLSRQECLRQFPDLERPGLSGGALVYDCQVSSSERLLLSVARSASDAGAHLANYVEVTRFLRAGDRIVGVKAVDRLSGSELEIQARMVVNASGPWVDRVLGLVSGDPSAAGLSLSKAFNVLVDRPLTTEYAIGIYSAGASADSDALSRRRSRLYFVTPWHGRSLIGTAHLPDVAGPDHVRVTEVEIRAFLDEINRAYPAAELKRQDVCRVYAGLLPMAGSAMGAGGVRLLQHYRIRDHGAEGLRGLISVIGVKFTEARLVAERTVDLIVRRLGKSAPRSATAHTRVHGGQTGDLETFLASETQRRRQRFDAEIIDHLVRRHGSAYSELLEHLEDTRPPAAAATTDCHERLLTAEVLHGIRSEMAQTLADVVFRRTQLGMMGNPGDTRLERCAEIMAAELGWGRERTQGEIEAVKAAFTASASDR